MTHEEGAEGFIKQLQYHGLARSWTYDSKEQPRPRAAGARLPITVAGIKEP